MEHDLKEGAHERHVIIWQLHLLGWSYSEIAGLMAYNPSTIGEIILKQKKIQSQKRRFKHKTIQPRTLVWRADSTQKNSSKEDIRPVSSY